MDNNYDEKDNKLATLNKWWKEFLVFSRWIMGIVIIVLDCCTLNDSKLSIELPFATRFLQFIFLFVLGLIVLPPIDRRLFQKLNLPLNLIIKYVAYYILVMLGVYIGNTTELNATNALTMTVIPALFFILTASGFLPIFLGIKAIIYLLKKVMKLDYKDIKEKTIDKYTKIKDDLVNWVKLSLSTECNVTLFGRTFDVAKVKFILKIVLIVAITVAILVHLPVIFNAIGEVLKFIFNGIAEVLKFIVNAVVGVFKFVVEFIKFIFALGFLFVFFFIVGIISKIIR